MNKFLCIALLISNFVFSQNTVRIEYGVQFEGEFLTGELKKNEELSSSMDGIEGYMSKYKFELFYNNGISFYKCIPQMKKEDESTSEAVAKIFINYEDIFYRDIKNQTLIHNCKVDGTPFNVTSNYNSVAWEMTNETKKISGFTCFKATGNLRNQLITAWYCPQIPYSIGPNEFGSLPGLILELTMGKLKYMATTINLKYTDSGNLKLPKGKNVTSKEFDQIVEEGWNNFKNTH